MIIRVNFNDNDFGSYFEEFFRQFKFVNYYENVRHISFCYWVNRFRPVDNYFPEVYESMWKEREINIPAVQNVPISCWSLSGGDDYYRWSTNLKFPVTIFIGTTVRSLIDSFDEATSIFAGEVKYCDKPKGNPDDLALFSKMKAYQCEEEFRFCFPARVGEDDAGDGVFIKLKSVDWINSIHIGTLTDRYLAHSFFHFLKTIPSIKDKVHLSVINEKDEKDKKEK